MYNQKLTLLEGFRKGLMEIQLELADKHDLVNMLPVICSSIALLPFGMTRLRSRLIDLLNNKIFKDKFIRQSFMFFLISYYESVDIKRIFQKHKEMRKIRKTLELIYNFFLFHF